MGDWGRRVLAGSLLGAAFGVLLGLVLARVLWPSPGPAAVGTTPASTQAAQAPTDLPPQAPTEPALPVQAAPAGDGQEDALVLVAALYAVDGDLERAGERLAALGMDPEGAAAVMAEVALRQAADGNERLATDLATLAAALGQGAPELLAYVATPTATATPTLRPSATPSATPTPPPSATASPQPATSVPPAATRRPATATPPPAGPAPAAPTALPWDWWDRRVDLLEPPVRLQEAKVAPGERYWRLVRLEWRKQGEGGNALLYVTTLNEKGVPAWGQEVVVEHGAQERLYTSPKPGEPYGVNYPMFSTLNSYLVFVGGTLPSDRVTGLGLGESLNGMEHTTFVLVFQLTIK